jgi:hypothetical protein
MLEVKLDAILQELLSATLPKLSADNLLDDRVPPVPWFGDITTAKVATIGINPSHAEFFFKKNNDFLLLEGSKRRLLSWKDLGVETDQSTEGMRNELAKSCNNYFRTGNHYKWFEPFNQLLTETSKLNYLEGTACHLDLFPWVTTDVWRKLKGCDRAILVGEGKKYLNAIILAKRFDYIFMNGRTVINAIQEYFDQPLKILMHDKNPSLRQSVEIYAGQILGVPCLAWSANLQEYQGKKEDLIAVLKPYVSHFKIAGR